MYVGCMWEVLESLGGVEVGVYGRFYVFYGYLILRFEWNLVCFKASLRLRLDVEVSDFERCVPLSS